MSSLATVAVPLVCLACVCAQQPVQGVLAGSPTGIQVDGGISATDAELRVRTNGFTGPLLSFPTGQNLPNLREILSAVWPVGMGSFAVDLDDTSNGRDDVLIDEFGVLAVPPSNWAVLSFSLRQGAVGVPGSPIAVEAAAGGIGAALFSWLMPTPALPSQLVGGHAQLSHSRQVFGLAAGAEVDGVDIPVVLGRDQSAPATLGTLEPNFAALIATPQAIYFTVSSASAASTVTPDSWWLPGTPAANRSGATILRVIRSSSAGPWQGPMVWRRWADLGLNQSEDVDALAVDQTAQKVLFSVTGTARDQFLFADFSTDGGPLPPVTVTSAQGPVSTQVGKAQNDDVDAVCTLDPTLGSAGLINQKDEFGSSCGSPTTPLLGVTPSIHASAFRRRDAATTWFDTWMVGWPPLTGEGPGIAVPFVTLGWGNGPLLFLGPIHVRDVTDPFAGNPVHAQVDVPPPLPLQGHRIVFRWAAIDANVTEIAEAWPVQVFL